MKYFYLSILFSASFFVAKSQESSSETSGITSPTKKNRDNFKTAALSSHSVERNVARLEEGYTSYPGGEYIIKDYLVKGNFNLVEVTHGVSIAAGYLMDSQKYRRTPEKTYYIQMGEDQTAYKQVFLASKRKTEVLEVAKAVLIDFFKGDQEVIDKVKLLKEIDRSELKKLVQLYNKKHPSA